MASQSDSPPALDIDPDLLGHVRAVIDDVRDGKMVILVDDEDRENEGDLVFAAERVTPELINFMAKHGRGLICLTLTEQQTSQLELPLMASPRGGPALGTAFTLSIEARYGVTTGISAADRSRTIQVAIDDNAGPADIVTPGHVFPLKARRGGVLVRTGQTEGSVDLARLAGLKPAGVICEIMNDDGTMARMPDLEAFASEHGLKILTIADLIRYRLQTERLVKRSQEVNLRLDQTGTDWKAICYEVSIDGRDMLALVKGDLQAETLCRMHRGSTISDVFASPISEGGNNLRESIDRIEANGSGVIVYIPTSSSIKTQLQRLASNGASIGATPPRSEPVDALRPDATPEERRLREFGLGAQVLRDLGVSRIQLLTNHPKKIVGIGGYGLEIIETVPLEGPHVIS